MDIMFVMGLNGSQLDSKCKLETQDGLYGLFLESWGQKNNPQYNEALKTIIHRMQVKKIKKFDVFIASEPLLKNMPSKDERRLSNSDDGYFHINQDNAEKLRLELCRKQKLFSAYAKKEKPIGNGTKRIFLHAEELQSQNDWKDIVFGEDSCNFGLTYNLETLSSRAFKLLNKKLIKPIGVAKPSKSTTKVNVYLRCPDVVSYILKISNGICDNCSKPGPFINSLGIPYLEVHHVIPLSKGGPDTPENCVAVCPNCHKALHYAENINQITELLYKKCNRLQK